MSPRVLNLVCLVGLILSTAGCSRPPVQTWWKGNLHTHTFWSDGDEFPESVLAWYRDHEYDFVALSDHNTIAESDRWLRFDTTSVRYPIFREYLRDFGGDWVEYRATDDSVFVRLKRYEEYSGRFTAPGEFLIIRSEEITDRFEEKPIHVNATNIKEFIPPQGGSSVVDVMQRNVNAVLEQRRESGQPMFPHINHPNFGWALTAEEIAEIEGERFIEVYNGHPSVHNEGDSLHPSVEMIWDIANTIRRTRDMPLMFGLAVDDSHNYQEMAVGRVNPGRGWIMVNSPELTAASLIESMEMGSFYASTGVELQTIDFDGTTLRIVVSEEEGVSYRIQFYGAITAGRVDAETVSKGKLLSEKSGSEASYSFSGNELFVRAKVISSRLKSNPYREGEFERAWTQPVIPD